MHPRRQTEEAYRSPVAGFNSVLPTKVYGIWGVRAGQSVKLDELPANNVSEAMERGKKKWGDACRSAILIPNPSPAAREPMFLNE